MMFMPVLQFSFLDNRKSLISYLGLIAAIFCVDTSAADCDALVKWSANTVFDQGVLVQQGGKKYKALVRSRALSP